MKSVLNLLRTQGKRFSHFMLASSRTKSIKLLPRCCCQLLCYEVTWLLVKRFSYLLQCSHRETEPSMCQEHWRDVCKDEFRKPQVLCRYQRFVKVFRLSTRILYSYSSVLRTIYFVYYNGNIVLLIHLLHCFIIN